jgi:hypothetical protein
MPRVIDSHIKNGTVTKIALDGHGDDRKLLVKTEQDIAPNLLQNAEYRKAGSIKGNDNQVHMRMVADIPEVIYLGWKNKYGFDIFSPEKSDWGFGMTRAQHGKFLRALINATPALKTVDERL